MLTIGGKTGGKIACESLPTRLPESQRNSALGDGQMASPFLPSVEDQLQARRDETESGFACVHIDTCLSSFLNDHHHRDGELLLGAIVFGDTTIGAVKNELLSEFNSIAYDLAGEKPGYDHDKARQAILDLFADVHPMDLDRSYFDSSLDIRAEDDEDDWDEYVQAWFLITWNLPDAEDGPSD
jgi:hypothetical protein